MDKKTLRNFIENDNSEYMSEQQRSWYASHLRTELQSALTLMESSQSEDASGDVRFSDPADRATHQEISSLADGRRDKAKAHADALKQALRAIRNDDFGYCCKCGDEIGHQRLLATPYALMDVECASKSEMEIKKNTGR